MLYADLLKKMKPVLFMLGLLMAHIRVSYSRHVQREGRKEREADLFQSDSYRNKKPQSSHTIYEYFIYSKDICKLKLANKLMKQGISNL